MEAPSKKNRGPNMELDPTHREVCWLPGAQIRDVHGKLSTNLITTAIGCSDWQRQNPKSLRAIKRVYRSLGQLGV